MEEVVKTRTPDTFKAAGNRIAVWVPEVGDKTKTGIIMSDDMKKEMMKKQQCFVEIHSIGSTVHESYQGKEGFEVVIGGAAIEHPAVVSDRPGFKLALANYMDIMAISNERKSHEG